VSSELRQITGIFDCLRMTIAETRPDVTALLGAQYQHTNEATPRIVVFPTDENFTSPVKTATQTAATVINIWTGELTLTALLWGSGIDETEELRRMFIQALDDTLSASYDLISGSWDAAGETAESGLLYTLLFSVSIPVTLFASGQTIAKIGSLPLTKTVITP